MQRLTHFLDWLFKDLTTRRGSYVIVEAPNLPLMIFMVSIILSVVIYPGPIQKFFAIVAYISLIVWGWQEMRTGRSRFRKLLGGLGLISVVTAVAIGLGL